MKTKKMITFMVTWSYDVEVESDEELSNIVEKLETEIYEEIDRGYLTKELICEVDDIE